MTHKVKAHEARQLVLEHAKPRVAQLTPLVQAVGLALAEDVFSFRCGDKVDASMVEQLAQAGQDAVPVIPPPCLAVITVNGSEQQAVLGLTLNAMAREAGLVDTHHVEAELLLEDLAFVLDHVAAADLVLFTHAEHELGVQAVTHHGAEMLFHGVWDPAADCLLAGRKGSQLLFGLPSTPRDAHACFRGYVLPAIRRMMGRQESELVTGQRSSTSGGHG